MKNIVTALLLSSLMLAGCSAKRQYQSQYRKILLEYNKFANKTNDFTISGFHKFKAQSKPLFDNVDVGVIKNDSFDINKAHSQVLIYSWQTSFGIVGYADCHVETTEDKAVYDKVIQDKSGHLKSHALFTVEKQP